MLELYINIYKKKFIEEHIVKFMIDSMYDYEHVVFYFYEKRVKCIYDRCNTIDYPIPETLLKYGKFFKEIYVKPYKEYRFISYDRHMAPVVVKFV